MSCLQKMAAAGSELAFARITIPSSLLASFSCLLSNRACILFRYPQLPPTPGPQGKPSIAPSLCMGLIDLRVSPLTLPAPGLVTVCISILGNDMWEKVSGYFLECSSSVLSIDHEVCIILSWYCHMTLFLDIIWSLLRLSAQSRTFLRLLFIPFLYNT